MCPTISSDIIEAVRELFIVRDDCYPLQIQGLNEYKVIKQKFTDDIIKKHLQGLITVGSFQIDPYTNKVKWICFDFDGELEKEFEKAKILFHRLKEKGYNPLMEFSGRRGYHIWLFVEPIDAALAKRFAHEIAKDIEVSEIFPKQEKIETTGFGGQVKVPLGIHRVSMKQSYFFDNNFQQLPIQKSINVLIENLKKDKNKIQIMNLDKFAKEDDI